MFLLIVIVFFFDFHRGTESHSCQCIEWIYLHLLLEWKEDYFEVINAPFLTAGFSAKNSKISFHRSACLDEDA